MPTPAYLEIGSKRVFACTLHWPGWCRSGKTEDDALETLAAYAERYVPVAAEAGVRFPKSAADTIEVVERRPGSGATDFGALDKPASADAEPLSKAQAERLAALVGAAWTVFDRVVAGAPATLRKGPRGGGRDRDQIVDHVLQAENAYIRKIGIRLPAPARDDSAAIEGERRAVIDAIRSARAPEPDLERGKPWPYRYAARRIAWHVLDHAWEIEDKSE